MLGALCRDYWFLDPQRMLGQYTSSLRVESLEEPGTLYSTKGLDEQSKSSLHLASLRLIHISFKMQMPQEGQLNSPGIYSLE